jgi:hypothetical protein
MADNKPRFKTYDHPAGGWGALAATAKALLEQSVVTKGSRALLAMNQPGGFKCPSCAFPDPDRSFARTALRHWHLRRPSEGSPGSFLNSTQYRT